MATTVNQPGSNPTNKLTAATLVSAAMSIVGLILRNLAPEWYDPEVMMQVTPAVVFLVGYLLIRDAPNVVVTQEEVEIADARHAA